MGLVSSRRGVLGIAALAALAALPAVAQGATAQVTVAAFVKPLNADLQSFYPARTFIHQGDSVRFVVQGFHTVTFGKHGPPISPAGGSNPATNDAAGTPFWWGGTTPQLQLTPAMILPRGKGVETGSQLLNSGVPQGNRSIYTVKFPKVGTFKYGCSVHPHMKGVVTVVPKAGAVPSAADRKALARAEEAADRASAQALNKKDLAKPANSTTITAGSGTTRLSLYRFYPKKVTVPAGTVVTFKLQSRNEVHTITFGNEAVLTQVGQGFIGGPPQFLMSGLGAYSSDPPGTVPSMTPTAHGNGFVNSGLVTDPGIPGPNPHSFKVRFPTPGTYFYACMIHENMFGMIVVT